MAMVFCPCGIFKSNLCLPRYFFSLHITLLIGPMEIVAKALEEGVNFSWDVGIRNLVVESDS